MRAVRTPPRRSPSVSAPPPGVWRLPTDPDIMHQFVPKGTHIECDSVRYTYTVHHHHHAMVSDTGAHA